MASITAPLNAPVVSDDRIDRLRRFNLVMGVLHLVSGGFMLLVSNDFSSRSPPSPPTGRREPHSPTAKWSRRSRTHSPSAPPASCSSPPSLTSSSQRSGFLYASELRAGRNRIRWIEYAASSTLMIVLIASVVGIYDAGALLAIAGANIAMILFGWLMETVNQPGRPVYWSPFWFGCIAGIAPWKAITASVWISVAVADDGPPGFVYGILVSIFLAFNCFALNQWLQYRGKGRWADYAHGEPSISGSA